MPSWFDGLSSRGRPEAQGGGSRQARGHSEKQSHYVESSQHRLWSLQEGMLHNMVMGRVIRSYATLNAKLEEGSGHVENPNPVPLDPDGAESWDETELD